jgi:tripartite-type tricarboxylate transporter receptor subunit TctC
MPHDLSVSSQPVLPAAVPGRPGRARRSLLHLPLAAAGAALAPDARSQAWPTRPIRIVVGFPAGNTLDVVSRLLAEALRTRLGQPVVVENKPGANGVLAATDVIRSQPDGHTLLATNSSGMTVNPQLYRRLGYQMSDFVPVTMIVSAPLIVMVNAAAERTAQVRSLGELVAMARARPGDLRFGSAGLGNITQLSVEIITGQAGVKLTTVPYKGTSASQAGLLGQEVDFALDTPLAVPLVRSGRLRALAVTSAQRWRDLPDVPTVAESGFPGFDVTFWLAWMAPAQTPAPVLAALHAAMGSLREDAALARQLLPHGVPGFPDPPVFAARMRAEHEAWGEVIRREKISLD